MAIRDTIIIEARIREATRILQLMPDQDRRYLADRKRASWPMMARETFDEWIGYGREKVTVARAQPSSVEIDRLSEVMDEWLPALYPDQLTEDLPPDTLKIVWIRCAGFTWDQISYSRKHLFRRRRGGRASVVGGNSKPSLRLIHQRALHVVWWRLKRDNVELVIPADWDAVRQETLIRD